MRYAQANGVPDLPRSDEQIKNQVMNPTGERDMRSAKCRHDTIEALKPRGFRTVAMKKEKVGVQRGEQEHDDRSVGKTLGPRPLWRDEEQCPKG